jgi:putative ABC transport system ATP-binding protein
MAFWKRDQREETDSALDGLIAIRDVVKTYKTPTGDFDALHGITLDFKRGEFVSVVGKSGSGKSTLLNMLTGIDRPTAGRVLVGGVDIHRMSESRMAQWRGKHMGIVFQFYQLLPVLTLRENVLLPMDFCGVVPPEAREQRALELLEMVGLSDIRDQMPASVSGGQQQSAAIARALANDPPILVADEPTGNLDSRSADVIFGIFDKLAAQGKTIVMVTHDDGLAARASRLVRLVDGEVAETTSLRSAPRAGTAPQGLRERDSAPRRRLPLTAPLLPAGRD